MDEHGALLAVSIPGLMGCRYEAEYSHNHAGVGDERVVSPAHLGDGLQQTRSQAVAEPKGVDRSRQRAHGPKLGNVSLGRTPGEPVSGRVEFNSFHFVGNLHVIRYAVGQDEQGRGPVADTLSVLPEQFEAIADAVPEIRQVQRPHRLDRFERLGLVRSGHWGELLKHLQLALVVRMLVHFMRLLAFS